MGKYKFTVNDYHQGMWYVHLVSGTEKHDTVTALANFLIAFGGAGDGDDSFNSSAHFAHNDGRTRYVLCVPLSQQRLLSKLPREAIAIVYFARFELLNLKPLFVTNDQVQLSVAGRGTNIAGKPVYTAEAWGPDLKSVWEVLHEHKLV